MPKCSRRSRSLPASLTKAGSELDIAVASLERAPQRSPPKAKSRIPKSRARILVSGASGTPKRCAPICGVKNMIPPAKLRPIETALMEVLAKVLSVREAMFSSSVEFGMRISELDEPGVESLGFMFGCIVRRVQREGSERTLFI